MFLSPHPGYIISEALPEGQIWHFLANRVEFELLGFLCRIQPGPSALCGKVKDSNYHYDATVLQNELTWCPPWPRSPKVLYKMQDNSWT